MDPITKLIEEFAHFPGVGPRQARRFAYYLLTRNADTLKEFTEALAKAKKTVGACISCYRLFSSGNTKTTHCMLCADTHRDTSLLMVVAHDVDVESVEKSSGYRGYYFVLGGTVPILETKPEERIRLKKLSSRVKEATGKGLKEIILALDLNPEGEHTGNFLTHSLAPLVKEHGIKISLLGRGLSTGTELQYSDPDTIKNALSNRAPAK
ncbi:MAG: hypothetical protein A3C06_01800 [Candidatus Taylorbacteria bacterium RIFCSPHIGHO2_02_FULL_46_13]|uniref:Recombination protein RecR n=1 Tax=Candidatus Taylorbacteria bacterium RIFCSPHIGHO2_02_FULL_46_13 TaxID=1802312 RepID=A0A1G2MTR2_9BACT|nr:MAG: hypothetical protein A3C06_01800 [Candidatus Taylorbacteria bacterium RIFCSPHIGHO2_02_FULL_46_13]